MSDYQFCIEHGNFHSMEIRDHDCIFENGLGEIIDPGPGAFDE